MTKQPVRPRIIHTGARLIGVGGLTADTQIIRLGRIEKALVATFGYSSEKEQALRARLQHFQKMGIPIGERPGRGKAIDYGLDECHQILLGIILSEHGIDPVTAARRIAKGWRTELRTLFEQAMDPLALDKRRPNPLLMTVQMHLMTAALSVHGTEGIRIGSFRRKSATDLLRHLDLAKPPWSGCPPWLMVVDLTKLVAAYNAELFAPAR